MHKQPCPEGERVYRLPATAIVEVGKIVQKCRKSASEYPSTALQASVFEGQRTFHNLSFSFQQPRFQLDANLLRSCPPDKIRMDVKTHKQTSAAATA